MEHIKINTYKLKQYREEMKNLGEALLETIPNPGEQEWSGKGKAPEQIQETEEKMDAAASSLYYLLQETIQVLKSTEGAINRADESAARGLESLQ